MRLEERVGAWLTEEGCFFRVWAPNATAVAALIQDGPYWEVTDTIIRQELSKQDGYWSGTVPGVRPWQLYRFELQHPEAGVRQHLDPAARDVLSSELTRHDPSSRNGSVVVDPAPYPFAPFATPRFEDFLIYQFHIGSFAGRGDHLRKPSANLQDVESKFSYIREMGFNCIQPLPVHEFAMDRSWGYNPASFFAPESSYGSPYNLAHFVDTAHRSGLAVIFDVVYNHAGPGDNVLWDYDGDSRDGGIYFEGGQQTDWGRGPAWWKSEVRDFFYQNARMFLEEYRADGLRFDVTTQINGEHLKLVIERLRRDFPGKYLVAEHLPDHPWIVKAGGFRATWHAASHHECQRALAGQDSLEKVKRFLGWDGYDHSWNLVKYTLGSHDDIGDQKNGDAEDGLTHWDRRHRYFVDQLGGREDWGARAKCRLAWALNVAMPGTPMLFMGSECHMASPHASWGYWHDGPDGNGDHRFEWQVAGDPVGIEMRRLVAACNEVRWRNAALRADSLTIPHEDHNNQVLGFVRASGDNVVLTVVNLGERNFTGHSYGVRTGGSGGKWTQVLCTQDAAFGGWDGAGNAFHEPWTQADGQVYINLPKWSVVMLRRS
ncbi:MAG: alpha amylase C-terminal domain-containing protein [Bryobacterales bacterium]|nr:alpha amylase C-terminal domain-containing protein [Bryobacterales bacterium]